MSINRTEVPTQLPVIDAEGHLAELMRRACAGEEVVLTQDGHPSVRLVPIGTVPERQTRREILEAARASGRSSATPGPSAARSQDFLYGDDES